MLQFAPAARLVPQVFANTNDEASAPVTLMLLIVTTEEPVLVMVTLCEAVVPPTLSEPNDKLVAESVSCSVAAGTSNPTALSM